MKSTEAENRSLIASLRAAGCPVPDGNEPGLPSDLTVELSRPAETRTYFYNHGAECVLALRVTNHSFNSLEIKRYCIQLPWPAPALACLVAPVIHETGREAYRLPRAGEFPYDSVLNHRVRELGQINPGENLEGILLAYSPAPIATDCLHNESFPANLSIFDQYGRQHSSCIDMIGDRSSSIDWEKLQRRPGSTNLFEEATPDKRIYVPEKRGELQVLAQKLVQFEGVGKTHTAKNLRRSLKTKRNVL
jgi:hypothetical protein